MIDTITIISLSLFSSRTRSGHRIFATSSIKCNFFTDSGMASFACTSASKISSSKSTGVSRVDLFDVLGVFLVVKLEDKKLEMNIDDEDEGMEL
ncbi:hypothetical protein Tco_0789464 [Tanacetum coccineum]